MFFPLKMKLEARHFDTVAVIEAESQAVLNTTSRVQLNNGSGAGNGAYTSTVVVPVGKQVSF
jgi:hypothetical protein